MNPGATGNRSVLGPFRSWFTLCVFWIALHGIAPYNLFSQEKRSRAAALYRTISATTAGEENLNLLLSARSFFWDNDAAQRPPFVLPDMAIAYGPWDWLDIGAGLQLLSYGAKPGHIRLEAKFAIPASHRLRFVNAAHLIALYRVLYSDFPSNGYRTGNEGFGPEGFMLGNESHFTYMKSISALDLDFLALANWLPMKIYFNLGLEWGNGSAIRDLNRGLAATRKLPEGQDAFMKLPMAAALEWQTSFTDFFVEFSAEPFALNVLSMFQGTVTGSDDLGWVRYRFGSKSFDVHLAETPAHISAGARMKYANGLTLLMGASWLTSAERGARLGPCHDIANPCRDAFATDGFSPFFAQWDVFLTASYPISFRQAPGEIYRSYLLKSMWSDKRPIDIEKELRKGDRATQDDREDSERLKQIRERRKGAGGEDAVLD